VGWCCGAALEHHPQFATAGRSEMYRKFGLAALTAIVVAGGFTVGSAQAGERWNHFRRMLPQIILLHEDPYYLYDDSADEEDPYLDPRYVSSRYRDVPDDYYEPQYEDQQDEYLTLPHKKRVYKQANIKPLTKPAKVAAKPVLKPVVKQVAAKPVTVKLNGVKPLATANVVKPKVKLSTVSLANPKSPMMAPKTVASQPTGISCAKATEIVSGYGFASVSPARCNGSTYAFNAARGGKTYLISVNASSGELTEVKKLQ
jgi:hypothetical protein